MMNKFLSSCCLLLVLTGCAAKPYDYVGKPGDATLTVASDAKHVPVLYALSQPDGEYRVIGTVYDADEANSNSFVKTMEGVHSLFAKKNATLEIKLPTGKPFNLSSKYQSSINGGQGTTYTNSCGPVYGSLTPRANTHYRATFYMKDSKCRMGIEEVNAPAK